MGAQILGCHSPTAPAAFSLLDLYVSKLPNGAKEKDAFYFTALPKTPEDPEKQYSTVPIGWKKLDRMVKDMFADAHISGKTITDFVQLEPLKCITMDFLRRPLRSELVTRASMVLEHMSDLA